MALLFACSWYDGLDLDALHSMRGDAPTNTDPAKNATRRARAYQLASYATTSTFIPVPDGVVEELSSTDDEEEEEAGDVEAEAEAEAPEEPAAGSAEQVPEAPAFPKSSTPLYQTP
jgi:cell division septation protein DedD